MVANGMKVAHLMTLKQKHYPRLSEWDRCNLKGPLEVQERGRSIRIRVIHYNKDTTATAGFEDE